MTTSIAGHKGDEPVATSRLIPGRQGLIVIWALFIAVTFNLINLYPDVAVTGLLGNDDGMHLLATDLAVQSIIQRQDFTDPWQSAIGMGHPLFHYYQHLPHISVALVHVLTFGVLPVVDMMNWASYLLLCLFPLSLYWSMRLFGFDRLSSAMGGLVASLTATNSLFGFDFGSYINRGLYTQLWAMVLLPPALASGYRLLLGGRGYFWATLLLAATLVSHLIYGYMAFLTLGVLTFLQPGRSLNAKSILKVMWGRWRRLIILLLLVAGVTSYFLVPFFLDRPYLNISVWDKPSRYDSFGLVWVLNALATGDLFDFGRFPSLTILVGVGFVICLLRWREDRYLIPVTIFLVWLTLYFGRATWGALIDLLPLSRDLFMVRFIAGVHLGGIYLMAVALATPWRWAISRRSVLYLMMPLSLTILILLPVYQERASELASHASALERNHQALAAQDQDLNSLVDSIKKLPPGRVYAGQIHSVITHWGERYRVSDSVSVFHMLLAENLDMMGVVYHRYSLNSDLEMIFDENRWEQYNLYNVRYVVAPEGLKFPDFVKPLQQFGRHRLYQVQTTGYFDLVGSDLAFAGGRSDLFPAASSWLASGLPGVKQHPTVLIGRSAKKGGRSAPLSEAVKVIPTVEAVAGPTRGEVLSEDVGSNFFVADVAVERSSLLLLKASYHPNWRATVDGVETETVMLMPSFVGVPLTPGRHQVRLEYRPRRLRMVLLGLGVLLFPVIALNDRRGGALSSWFTLSIAAPVSRLTKRRRRPR
jgi:hypothetical protein